MAHDIYIHAINSQANKALKKILEQWDSFLTTLNALNDEEQIKLIRSILTNNRLVQPLNKTLPLLNIPSDEVSNILFTEQPTADVYIFITERLKELGAANFYIYQLRKNQRPIMVFVWKEDVSSISKKMKKKLQVA